MGLLARLGPSLAFLVLFCSCQDEDVCENVGKRGYRIAALIPARAGSKGIKNKNLSVVRNETLLSRTLRIVRESRSFESVWVLTDGQPIAEEAQKHGAKVHWRDPQTATDDASTVSAVQDFLLNQKECDAVAVVQCTSPFLQENFLRNAADIMLEENADCVFSVTRSFQLRWNEDEDGFVFPLNFDPKKRPRRQQWEGELVENGMFYFVKSTLVLRDKVLQNDRCKTVEIPKQFSLEIDTETDLQLANALMPLLENSSHRLQL